jgi:prepilin-type N-terminal cleavage/methylation domain-containing protein
MAPFHFDTHRTSYKAFTLIELLIVVAIIGILAAIAVPNFLNAQLRAKIARVEGDLRAMKTAIEMYRADNSGYPPACTLEIVGDVQFRAGEIFSPVAYANVPAVDPFNTREGSRTSLFASKEYFYLNHDMTCGWPSTMLLWTVDNVPSAPRHVEYLISSQGPDNLSEIQDQRASPIFDATNGLDSQGDIIVFGP